jgi:predicted protein tyrosine phosphatase
LLDPCAALYILRDMIQIRKKLLFVCSRNKWRSPTAERIFSHSPTLEVRARGISASAVRRLVAADVSWADLIFVMELTHKRQLVGLFRAELGRRPVHVLDIPDEYQFMDPELVELLESAVRAIIGQDTQSDDRTKGN